MPKLIVLNGPPACGKSTLARIYAEDHPLSLNLDIDRIRDLIGGWRDDTRAGGLLARAIALAAARTHLDAGHDVIIPQLLAAPTFLEQVEDLARDTGAEFHEIVLLDTLENVSRRLAERSRGADPVHVDAQRMLDRSGGEEALSAMYDSLVALIATRPLARVIASEDGQVQRTYRLLLDSLR